MKNSKKKSLRRLGDITQDMEPLLLEMGVDHDMQAQEIMSQIYCYLKMHIPGCFPKYEDGTDPVYYYGHKDGIK